MEDMNIFKPGTCVLLIPILSLPLHTDCVTGQNVDVDALDIKDTAE
jgi:hypothetical protein